MSYLNLDLDYFNHPKTVRLVGLLGKGSEVLPIKLWCYCGKYHSENGKLTGYSAKEIESILGWWGKDGELVEALIKVELLEKIGEDFCVHEWTEHEGHLKAFKIRAKKAAVIRWNTLKCYKHATSNAKGKSKQCPSRTVPAVPSVPALPKERNVFDVSKEKGNGESQQPLSAITDERQAFSGKEGAELAAENIGKVWNLAGAVAKGKKL